MKTIAGCLATVEPKHLRDAQFLIAELIEQPLSFLQLNANYSLSALQLEAYQQGLAKLQQGMPLAYVVGHQPFWSLDFVVNEHTLIPRPDTEHLVEKSLAIGDALMQRMGLDSLCVLDMGTGSGAIAICLKHERPQWNVTATDMSEEALKVAQENAHRNNTDIRFLQGSWYEAIAKEHATSEPVKFHLVVSNPPYIAPDDEHLADLTDEPITALVADNQGMADIETIVAGAQAHLHESGWLLIEHGYEQGTQVRNCFVRHGFIHVDTIKDFGGNERVTLGMFA